jgi:hypothetical protein
MPDASEYPDAEPTAEELSILTQMGRIDRLVQSGLDPVEAAKKLLEPESAKDYAERNRAAMEALEARLLSPEYQSRFEAAQSEPDPLKREAAHATLKRENFAAIDMEAVHRAIAARNRQFKQEGLLPSHLKL